VGKRANTRTISPPGFRTTCRMGDTRRGPGSPTGPGLRELPRTPIPGTSVNKGKKKGRGYDAPAPACARRPMLVSTGLASGQGGLRRVAGISVLLDLPEHGPMCHHDAERGRTGRPRIYQMWVEGPAPLARNSTGAGRQNKIYLTYPKADCIPVSARCNLWSRVTVIRHICR
jgi:hypothetical protein